jgi:type I restriction enzyme S subunit
MKAIPIFEGMTKDFLYYFLQLPVLRQFVEMNSDRTAGQDGVNKAHLLQFRCFIPSPSEQAEIVTQVKSAFAQADRLEAEAERAHALLDRLESAILAKAFKGELAPQHPYDEPASVLLDRIRTQRASAPKAKQKPKSASRHVAA